MARNSLLIRLHLALAFLAVSTDQAISASQSSPPSAPVQQAYLKASNTNTFDAFGEAVAISGDTMVVGARREGSGSAGVDGDQLDNSAGWSGAAYVFVRTDSTWTQQAYLKASNPEFLDRFGYSVAIDGDTIVVGANRESSSAVGVNGDQLDNSAPDAGAAYVFVRNGTTWTQQAYLKAFNTDPGDEFGIAVAISGDTIAVGAPRESSSASGIGGDPSSNSSTQAGAVYTFVRNGADWAQDEYIKASHSDSFDSFGWALGLDGDTLIATAPGEDSDAIGVNGNDAGFSHPNSGSAYVFLREASGWIQQAYLKPSNTQIEDYFGTAVGLDGNTAVVGTFREDGNTVGPNGDDSNNDAVNSGAAYVFARMGEDWSQQAYLKASNTETHDQFGYSVAVANDTIVVGARYEDSNSTTINGDDTNNLSFETGAAYVFGRCGTGWIQQAYLKPSTTAGGNEFGSSVAIGQDLSVVVGVPNENNSATGVDSNPTEGFAQDSGAAYVYSIPSLDSLIQAGCPQSTPHMDGGFAVLNGEFIPSGSGCWLHLDATGGPTSADAFGIFLVSFGGQGSTTVGRGVLCLESVVGRYGAKVAANLGAPSLDSVGYFDANGNFLNTVGTSATGFGFDIPSQLPSYPGISTIQSGDTLFFQLWYRDVENGVPTSNLTDMIQVQFP